MHREALLPLVLEPPGAVGGGGGGGGTKVGTTAGVAAGTFAFFGFETFSFLVGGPGAPFPAADGRTGTAIEGPENLGNTL